MSIIDKRHVMVGLNAETSEEVIRTVGQMFRDTDCVKDTFIDAVIEREKVYPTGMNLKYNAIAMPHTFPKHVNRPGIALAKLDKPVTFMHMGSTGEEVHAEMIFMMAITNPEEQIKNLKKVMMVFMDETIVKKFRDAKDEEELYNLGKEYLE